jgi:hypothetical protein
MYECTRYCFAWYLLNIMQLRTSWSRRNYATTTAEPWSASCTGHPDAANTRERIRAPCRTTALTTVVSGCG